MQTVVFNSVYSGMGLSTDLGKGLFDRFRSLPIWSLAPFAGLMVGDMLRHLIAGGIILTIGLILGYRPEAGILGVLAAFAMLVTIGFGMGWIFIVLGLLIRTPMTVMTIGFTVPVPAGLRVQHHGRPEDHAGVAARVRRGEPGVADDHRDARAHGRHRDVRADRAGAHCADRLTLLLAPVTLWLYRRR